MHGSDGATGIHDVLISFNGGQIFVFVVATVISEGIGSTWGGYWNFLCPVTVSGINENL
jgi:hypothetical protein